MTGEATPVGSRGERSFVRLPRFGARLYDSLMSGPFMSRMLRIVMDWCQGGASAEAGQAVTPPPAATAT